MVSFGRIFIYFLVIFLVSGCKKTYRVDDVFVSRTIENKINKTVQWNKYGLESEKIQSQIQGFLKNELTVDTAVQIALLNNPHIQAMYEEMGISQADLLEAGLLSNPVFDLFLRYPAKKKFVSDIEYSVTQNFIDLFLIPLREKVAKTELELITLKITNEILNLAFDVEQTYYELQAAQKDLSYVIPIVELISIDREITSRQQMVGNINALEFQQIQSRFLEANLEIATIENEIIRLKEKLNRLLGFCGEIHWTISNGFSEIDYKGLPINDLECVALRERLDLQVSRFEVVRLSRKLGIKQWWVYTDGYIGIGGERDPDGLNTIGPAFSGSVPVFNYGQADRLRIYAELRQAQDEVSALEIRILSEVREAHKLLMNNLSIIREYKNQIIPLQNKVLESSEQMYNVMGIGINRLLENKIQALQVYRNYNLSVRNYWIARVQLDRALGGKLYKIYSYKIDPFLPCCQEGVIE